ncbi:formylglycine-generating enzyme family protein [Alkalinema sp. FACHB-956]|nr:formylglycine-generating enzyme family protein [Alkalinema sp. FACHB-956]
MASPLAKRLVQLMAAAPVSLSVVYLIQETMLRESWQVHAAEVFMSGLIRAVPGSEPLEYEFVPGVRSELAKMVRVSESLLVLDRLSEYFASRAGLAVKGFQALLVRREFDGAVRQAELLPLLRVMPEVLSRLGKDYVDWAEQAANVLQVVSTATEIDAEAGFLAGLLDFEFEIAEYVEESSTTEPEIQTFEFELLTFQQGEAAELEDVPDPLAELNWRRFTFKVATVDRQKHITTRPAAAWEYVETIQVNRLSKGSGMTVEMEMVAIPEGQFLMGSHEYDEQPVHPVKVAPFLMGKYPVTQAQWRFVAKMESVDRKLNPDPARFKGDNRPVEQVSWHDAMEFCARLSRYTGREYRLPTEAEWEYACRAGTRTRYHCGDEIANELANYGRANSGTTAVGQFSYANEFGLFDLHGNVWEWCLDNWHWNYRGAPGNGSAWLDPESFENAQRILRGGSWSDDPRLCCSTSRFGFDADDRYINFGFRVISCA